MNGRLDPSSSSSSSTLPSSTSPHTAATTSTSPQFDSIDAAVEAVASGQFVVVLDDEDRENEGDLIIAASKVTTEQMAWMIRHTSGFICISLHPERLERFDLPMMVAENQDPKKTAYTVTVDYRRGTTTGISAHDRALTCRMLGADLEDSRTSVTADDFSRPGHVCPLRYTEGGVRVRRGHTEASVDLAIAASLPSAAIICELVDPDSPQGNIASRDACFKFARQHGLKIITIEALQKWREEREGKEIPGVASNIKGEELDKTRGVKLEEQKVVGPNAA